MRQVDATEASDLGRLQGAIMIERNHRKEIGSRV